MVNKVGDDMNDNKKTHNPLEHNLAIIQAIPTPVFIKDSDLKYVACNQSFLDMFSLKEEQVYGKTQLDIVGLKSDGRDAELMKHGGKIEFEIPITSTSYKKYYYSICASRIESSAGEPIGIVGFVRDITEQKIQENRAQRLMQLKDAMIEITHSIMDNPSEQTLYNLVLEKGVEIINNSAYGSILMRDENDMFSPVAWIGYTNESMANFKVHMYQTYNWRATNGHLENSAMINDLAPYMHTNVPDVQDTEDSVTIKSTIYSPIIIDGQLIGLMNMDSTMLNAFTEIDMELVNYMSQQIEITLTKHQLYDQVLYLSQHDELTGLFNRRQFESLVQEKINESKITDEDFCIILLDINDLKKINDSFGHQVGDSYIQTFAKELKGLFRESDYFCRYGGDEFVGICTMKKEKIKERLENALKNLKTKPMIINDKNIIISFSFGITSYPNDGQDYDTLINVADRLMYENKLKSKKINI